MTSRLLFLDSSHSTTGSTPSDCSFVLNFPVANDITGYGLSIQNIGFPNVVYPVNSTNNKIYFKENGGSTLTATITSGFYNGEDFASEIQTQLNSFGSLTYTCEFQTLTKSLNVSVLLPNLVQFVEGDNNANEIMGYDVPTQPLAVSIASGPVRLDGSLYLDVQSSIGNLNYSSNGKSNLLFRVPITAPFGSINFYENPTDDYLQIVESDIFNLEIRLLDDKGNLFDLPFNSNVFLTIKMKPL
jgi:hypothetical protein